MYAIKNVSNNTYIAVETAAYIYTKLPGHIKTFPSYAEALEYFDEEIYMVHDDYRPECCHRIVHLD